MEKTMKTVVFSLGGSVIVPDGIDASFLKQFRDFILDFSKSNRAVIVVGGGKICRNYQSIAKTISPKISNDDLDWIGIKATYLNAELVRSAFGVHAHPVVIIDPSKKVKSFKKIIVASGWKPGRSTDFDAVLLAKQFKAETIINMTNVDYVYDKDPKFSSDAMPIKSISWNKLISIVGSKWDPGRNVVFDPVASKKARELKLKVFIVKGTNLRNIKSLLDRKVYSGTIIS